MQTLYYSTTNWTRHTDNIVDLEQYRRRLSQAEDSQPEEPELTVLPQSSAPRARRSQRLRRRALLLDACASMGILVMTLTFALRALAV